MPAVLMLCLLPAQTPEPVSFSRDVVPALTRSGCNSGACHGSFQGRGGFRLSLLGFDPAADFEALTREARGRRVFPAVPEQSLLLLKPTGALPHGGGKKITSEMPAYRILRDWIVQGMRGPSAADPVPVRLDVTPREVVLKADQVQPLSVKVTWSDGKSRDVTPWSLFETNKDDAAVVSSSGVIRGVAPGRASVMVRSMGHAAAVSVTVPHEVEVKAGKERNNFIDDHLAAAWKQVGVEPAPLCDDAAFFRRVHLDLIGTLPTAPDVLAFLANEDPKRREKLVDELLERPEYVDHWATKWSDLLRAHRRALGEKGLVSFNGWMRTALRENRPFDAVVRDLLTAQGNLYKNGAAAYYFIDKEPQELAETTAQVFLGIRIGCAKCHHHPFEVWSQDDYNGLASFFNRVQRKDTKDEGLFGGSMSIGVAPGKPFTARILGGPPMKFETGADPRPALAEWITSKDNPYFARSLVNRYWGYLFGRGLVEPIDDLRASNPASHPALLDELTKGLIESKYDLKRLLRTLCNSRAYQLAAETSPRRDIDGVFFTHRKPRRLPAEVLLDAVNIAAGTPEDFVGLPVGTRAISLPDPAVTSLFLDTFGRPKRTTSCECERPTGTDLAQVLHLINSERLHAKVTSKTGRVALLMMKKKTDAEVVEHLYLSTLSRKPTAEEHETVKKLLSKSPSRREGFEDLLWTLLNMTEFACNH